MEIVVTLLCTLAIMGSHLFFLFEHKAIYTKLEELEKKIDDLKRTNSNS
jgi:hypothetical protein